MYVFKFAFTTAEYDTLSCTSVHVFNESYKYTCTRTNSMTMLIKYRSINVKIRDVLKQTFLNSLIQSRPCPEGGTDNGVTHVSSVDLNVIGRRRVSWYRTRICCGCFSACLWVLPEIPGKSRLPAEHSEEIHRCTVCITSKSPYLNTYDDHCVSELFFVFSVSKR